MTKYFLIYTFSIILFFNTSAQVANSFGSGNLKMSEKTINSFYNYISSTRKKSDKFLVTIDGKGTYVWVCPQTLCLPAVESFYTKPCFKLNNNKTCKIFATGRKVRWNTRGKVSKNLNFLSKMIPIKC